MKIYNIKKRTSRILHTIGLDTQDLRNTFGASLYFIIVLFLFSLLASFFSLFFFSFFLGAFVSTINLLLLIYSIKKLFKENDKKSMLQLFVQLNIKIIFSAGIFFLLAQYFSFSIVGLMSGIIIPHICILVQLLYMHLNETYITKDS